MMIPPHVLAVGLALESNELLGSGRGPLRWRWSNRVRLVGLQPNLLFPHRSVMSPFGVTVPEVVEDAPHASPFSCLIAAATRLCDPALRSAFSAS